MKRTVALFLATSMMMSPVVLSGCQTYGEAAGLGAGVGALAGGIIGHQSGHALEGAAIGALVGGIGGLIAQDIKVRQERSRQQTVETYNYTETQGLMVQFERAEVLPSSARPGTRVQNTFQYAILGAGAGISVTEHRSLLQGDRLLGELSSKTFTREDGTWVSTQEFQLPNDMRPGLYSIETRVTAGSAAPISGRANFSVQ